ncbi:SET domain-containing protein [Sphingomonas lenta]|uniref:SET domain-containing protein-lysine N-methyltransferase n=1 Tax=Sphingomonas lenta TaxID=1141887 RepID=A0A2A2SH62_9SPHN|nr:SET domain-containing protein [Sphingomonas lenta]PAX08558.1 SET domain-containing protein-lysine N-methyltransferase [Sphingomonas lenta]
MQVDPWLIGAIALAAGGYATYLLALTRNLVEPNRTSWLIWAAATGVEAGTYAAVNPDAPQAIVFALSTVACVVVTAAMWRRSRWRAPDPLEIACLVACLGAITLWVFFRQAFWAHMLVVAAVPVSFWPTWASVREDAGRERTPAWGLWTLGDFATLVVATRAAPIGLEEHGYVFVELVCHASVWLMIGLGSILPRRRAAAFAVRDTHLGRAVFAAEPFAEGQAITRFSGRRVGAGRVRWPLEGADDRFVQVAPDAYLGPSGRIDDLINHSCDPNAGLRFTPAGVLLVAIRPIQPGEEIAWDYSTTVGEAGWRMACRCGSAKCRGVVEGFTSLPEDRRRWFEEQGLVAPYLQERAAQAA